MSDQTRSRRSYEDSWKVLQSLGYFQGEPIPPISDHPPRYDDEEPLGVNFFRTFVGEGSLEDLTLRSHLFC